MAAAAPSAAVAATDSVVEPVNPVTQSVSGHAANSGFLVFVEGEVRLFGGATEGAMALGGDLAFESSYDIAGGATLPATIQAAADAHPTRLYVGGGAIFPLDGGYVPRVLGDGYVRIGDTSTYTLHSADQYRNPIPWQAVERLAPYGVEPRIQGTVPQPPASAADLTGVADQIDLDGAFRVYRTTSTALAGCEPTGQSASGLALVPGMTNFFEISAADLAKTGELVFSGVEPSADTPLVLNVTGLTFAGDIPKLTGLSSASAPYVLWNFPGAISVVVEGGADLEGTIYAPFASVHLQGTQQFDGAVIAASFLHGDPQAAPGGTWGTIRALPFATEVDCGGGATPGPQPEPEPGPAPAPAPEPKPGANPPPAPEPAVNAVAAKAAAKAKPRGTLPATGFDVSPLGWAALAISAGGVLVAFGARRIRTRIGVR